VSFNVDLLCYLTDLTMATGHLPFRRPLYILFALVCISGIINADKQSTKTDEASNPFLVGTGIYDITGPVAEVGFMGYAMLNQIGYGLHFRLRARAYIVVDRLTQQRVAFVSADLCFTSDSVKLTVVERLKHIYGNTYTIENVMISATHTHDGPGGYNWYPLYDVTTWGFHNENFDVIVDGIVNAIQRAHERLQVGRVVVNTDTMAALTNINRSPSAYELNPESERQQWSKMGNTDKFITLLKFVNADGVDLGAVTWFSVHGTSMSNTNGFVSGDNKGYASMLWEEKMNPNGTLPGMGNWVGAVAQSNEGDVSPNTRGAFCDNGSPCDYAHSTCGGTSQGCHGYGPGRDEFESTKIIGTNQFKKAHELYQSASTVLQGPVDFRHTFLDMEHLTVTPAYSGQQYNVSTCVAALGDSFAGGTTDGPGDFDFVQGTNSSKVNPYWNWLASHVIADPPEDQVKCHHPKPILLYVGGMTWPSRWTPGIMPIQLFRLGNFYIIGVPGEFTTMSGRRLRASVLNALKQNGAADDNTVVVIAGLSNQYSHYIATAEEYAAQRYEGASTIFGPWTLAAYQQEFSKLAKDIATGTPSPFGVAPEDLSQQTFSLQPDVELDTGPFGTMFTDAKPSYKRGETVEVVFYTGSPRNNFKTQDTFLTVEKLNSDNTWTVIRTDGNWDTKYRWSRRYLTESLATITWEIGPDVVPGTYRIQHFGDYKDIWRTITPFHGSSRSFTVTY
jgi:neutral ceramidase